MAKLWMVIDYDRCKSCKGTGRTPEAQLAEKLKQPEVRKSLIAEQAAYICQTCQGTGKVSDAPS